LESVVFIRTEEIPALSILSPDIVEHFVYLEVMKADVYKTNQNFTFLIVPAGSQVECVPQQVIHSLGSLRLFKTIELDVSSMVGANPAEVRTDLERQGYSIRQVKFKIGIVKSSSEGIFS
jgi:uncharacterized protein YcgL (UPF0745 family)